METAPNFWKIPDASEIAKTHLNGPEDISYTLSYELKANLKRTREKAKEGCLHRTIEKWRCSECSKHIANFNHFLDQGGHSLYFSVLDWKEIVLPDIACVYKGYNPNDAVELREYMMLLLSVSINETEKISKTVNLSLKLAEYIRNKNKLWEQHSKKQKSQVLKFNSLFECGNLERVAIINPGYYLITVKPDTNTCGTSQWFYFSVSNTSASATIKFEIINFTKKTKLYRAGMRIWVFSRMLEKKSNIGWHKAGKEIEYKGNEHIRKPTSQYDDSTRKHFYSLSFKYTFEYDNDEVFFAYACPYPYTRACKLIAETEKQLEQTARPEYKITNSSAIDGERKHIILKDIIYQRECYTKTVCGIPSYLATVTASPKAGLIPIEKRKAIVVTGRVHAGETSSSFTLEGFWNFLFSKKDLTNHLGGSEYSKIVLGLYVVKVIPCLNPDGVIIGNSRTGVEGADLNRVWQKPCKDLHPTIHSAMKMMEEIRKLGEIEAYCDLHTHSDKCNSFIYGCPLPVLQTFAAWTKTHLLPKMIAKLCPKFSYRDCIFTIHPSKV